MYLFEGEVCKDNDPDDVEDTPRHLMNSGCPAYSSTCGDDDRLHNYMNYTKILEQWSDIKEATLVLDKLTELYPDKETEAEKQFVLSIYGDFIDRMGAGSSKQNEVFSCSW